MDHLQRFYINCLCIIFLSYEIMKASFGSGSCVLMLLHICAYLRWLLALYIAFPKLKVLLICLEFEFEIRTQPLHP
jgi:hypothetical protein